MNKATPQEFEELSIATVPGLQVFLRNAQAQYNIGLEKESALVAAGGHNDSDALHHAFQTVRHTTNKLISGVQSGDGVSNSDAKALQRDYDELVRVIDSIPKATTQAPPEPTKKLPVQPEPKAKKIPVVTKQPVVLERKEQSPIKPKTGSLRVAADDGEDKDTKMQMTISDSAKAVEKKQSNKKQKFQKQSSKETDEPSKDDVAKHTNHIEKIKPVIKQGQHQYAMLKKKYRTPNLVQALLLEEVRESIEYLELLSKKPHISKEKLSSVSEVASHLKYALEGVEDANELPLEKKEAPNSVPIVTEQVQSKEKVNHRPISFVPVSVTTNRSTVAKRSVPKQLQTLPKPNDIYTTESLTEKYLTAPKHKQFINEYYSSPAGFEQLLDATITKVEADTIDSIEKWLGDLPASAFAFLADMQVSEVLKFADRPFDQVNYDLQEQNIKYETFVSWRDMINEMLESVQNGEKMKFEQLFALWMIDMAMDDGQ